MLIYDNTPKKFHTNAGLKEELEIETNSNVEPEDQTKVVETIVNELDLVITKNEFEQFTLPLKPKSVI